MIDILNKYLVQHKSLNIPGLGSIHIEKVPARTDFVNKQILPPFYTLWFDKHLDNPDKDFFNYLASQKNIPEHEAIRLYNQFAEDIRSKINLEEKVELRRIGIFSKNNSGE